MLDPVIVSALINPVRRTGGLSAHDDELLSQIAAGRTIKAIASAARTTPGAVEAQVERLFIQLATAVSAGEEGALDRLRRLHEAIVEREEQGETLSRMLPTGVADTLLAEGRDIGETERLEVTVLMSDVRGYTSIAEHADPVVLAGQLNRHRAEMNRAVLGAGGTVMQYVGDAVMAVFGAPVACSDHAATSVGRRRGDASGAARRERGVARRGARSVRARDRAEHWRGRRRPARQRRARRVHARRRRREPLPAIAAVRRTRRDGAQRGDRRSSR